MGTECKREKIEMWKCFAAGVISCIGSLFSKYAFGEGNDSIIFRGVMVLAMLYANTKGLTMLVESLQTVPTPIGVLLSTSGNVLTSTVIGAALGEALTANLLTGTVLILIGTYLVHSNGQSQPARECAAAKRD